MKVFLLYANGRQETNETRDPVPLTYKVPYEAPLSWAAYKPATLDVREFDLVRITEDGAFYQERP